MAFDAKGQYILFSSDSPVPTRAWSRVENQLQCCPAERLKYYALKNPPATVKTPLPSCASLATTVVVGGVTYAIDPAIYKALKQSLLENPVQTLTDLQVRITQIRFIENTPVSMAVQMSRIPLSRVFARTTYPAGNNKWKDQVRPDPHNFPFRVSSNTDIIARTIARQGNWVNFNAVFYKRTLMPELAVHIEVANDRGCTYSNRITDLYGNASDNGKLIRSSLQKRIDRFTPLICIMVPLSSYYPIQFGMMFGFNEDTLRKYTFATKPLLVADIKQNGEFIFVPALTQLEIIEAAPIAPGSGVSFPVTNDGNYDLASVAAFNSLISNYYLSNFTYRTLLNPAPPVPPQIVNYSTFKAFVERFIS
jgi:hypothetical protein